MSNYFYYVRKRMFYKPSLFLLSVLVMALGLTVFGYLSMDLIFLKNYEKEAYKYIRQDKDQCGVIEISLDEREELIKVYEELVEGEEIESIGAWYFSYLSSLKTKNSEEDIWKKMLEISNQHVHILESANSDADYSKEIDVVRMPSQAFLFNNYKLSKGSKDTVKKTEKNLIYLGYNYRDIPIGTILYDEETKKEYEVAGVLEKNTYLLAEYSLLCNWGGVQLSCINPIDNFFLVVPAYNSRENITNSLAFFSVSDQCSFQEGVKKIQDTFKKHGLGVNVGTYEARVETITSDAAWIHQSLLKISIVIISVAYMIMVVAQLLISSLKQKELGVWILSGLSRKKIWGILFGENFIKSLIAGIVAFLIQQLLLKDFLFEEENVILMKRLQYVYLGQFGIFLLTACFLLAAVISLLSVYMIRNETIKEQLYSN